MKLISASKSKVFHVKDPSASPDDWFGEQTFCGMHVYSEDKSHTEVPTDKRLCKMCWKTTKKHRGAFLQEIDEYRDQIDGITALLKLVE